jgi:hypothetical protein
LKNALDYLYAEWNNKPAGVRVVRLGGWYAGGGGAAVDRGGVADGDGACAGGAVVVPDFENFSTFRPAAHHEMSMTTLFDQRISWSQAMKLVREGDQTATVYSS